MKFNFRVMEVARTHYGRHVVLHPYGNAGETLRQVPGGILDLLVTEDVRFAEIDAMQPGDDYEVDISLAKKEA